MQRPHTIIFIALLLAIRKPQKTTNFHGKPFIRFLQPSNYLKTSWNPNLKAPYIFSFLELYLKLSNNSEWQTTSKAPFLEPPGYLIAFVQNSSSRFWVKVVFIANTIHTNFKMLSSSWNQWEEIIIKLWMLYDEIQEQNFKYGLLKKSDQSIRWLIL